MPTNGVLFDFSQAGYMYQDLSSSIYTTRDVQYVSAVDDARNTGAYSASAADIQSARHWRSRGYLEGAFRGRTLSVTLPDLGQNCTIVTVTPGGCSIQRGRTIPAGAHALPPYPLEAYAIIDRDLTEGELAQLQTLYGDRDYFIDYDTTIAARPQSGTVYHTADLGWVAGTDVGASGQMQTLIDTLADGDTVVLDAMYHITGVYNLTALSNITFRAASRRQCGFNCLDAFTQIANTYSVARENGPVFTVGDGFLADGLHLTWDEMDPAQHDSTENKVWFRAVSKAGVYLRDCLVDAQHALVLYAPDTTGIIFARCRFENSRAPLSLFNASDNALMIHCYHTGGFIALYDGIKTVHNNGVGPADPMVVECEFTDIVRDGIDTTGGFKNASIIANIFRNCEITPLDIKSTYPADYDYLANGPIGNSGIRLRYNLFDDVHSNAIVETTTWEIADPAEPPSEYKVQLVESYRNCYVPKENGTSNLLLNKGGCGLRSVEDTFWHKLKWSNSWDNSTNGDVVYEINSPVFAP